MTLSLNYKAYKDAEQNYGFTPIAGIAMYGDKDDLDAHLNERCTYIKSRIVVASLCQQRTDNTLFPEKNHKRIKPYGFTVFKALPVFGRIGKRHYEGTTINKKDFCNTIVKHTGVLALHFYIKDFMTIHGQNSSKTKRRFDIFQNILNCFACEDPAKELHRYLKSTQLPEGFFSSEFKDLCEGLLELNSASLKSHIQEYREFLQTYTEEVNFNDNDSRCLKL